MTSEGYVSVRSDLVERGVTGPLIHNGSNRIILDVYGLTIMDPVTLEDADPDRVHEAFLGWAARRQRVLRQAR